MSKTTNTAQTERLLRDLPDPINPRLFFEQITREHPRAAKLLADPGLLADALALAAWSPLLATTLAQHPDYLTWLARERLHTRVKTDEEFGESLGRFALTNSQLTAQILLARFRRRELLRIYLLDIRKTGTLVETTEELSNLADAVLVYALGLARQELDNRYGPPLRTDERGRTAIASFCIVALGKLGSRELNYSSDIDLMFLYSDDGATAGGADARGSVTNREYFVKLAEMIARLVGQPAGEGAAYRVDLRLRPHGHDGALSCSLAEAVRYYREMAQPWELQTLIRARAAAGSARLYTQFADELRRSVYHPGETVQRALAHVRLAKQKIDHHQSRTEASGFNVKLGRGGIREIEFIAQALQLAYGGIDDWLRAPHTLISLGRLADRGFITERERSDLSDAYDFLRTLEHRLQMEHGLQTHLVPEDVERRLLVARRMNYVGGAALSRFNCALQLHTTNVRSAYDRVFGESATQNSTAPAKADATTFDQTPPQTTANHLSEAYTHRLNAATTATTAATVSTSPPPPPPLPSSPFATDAATAAVKAAAASFQLRFALSRPGTGLVSVEQIANRLSEEIRLNTPDPRRSATLLARVASSLDKYDAAEITLTDDDLLKLVRLCGSSEFLGEMIASNPILIAALRTSPAVVAQRDYTQLLNEAVQAENSFGAELAALRRSWTQLLIETGREDAAEEITLPESTRRQTGLAAAALDVGFAIARRELIRRHGSLNAQLQLAVLGLGRLGSAGIDYGSDLDVVLVYDDTTASPIESLTHTAIYGRFAELFVTALSSVTREGYLYRVDLRLRPDGKNGPLAIGAQAFVDYLRDRAGVWEWLAYVKLRAAAGHLEFGSGVEQAARHTIHDTALLVDGESLRIEARRVRQRLADSHARTAASITDIKFRPGGMLDVYFAVRYLQLRDNVPDEHEDRSTGATLERLRQAGSLSTEDYRRFSEGYRLLRRLDHFLRIILGRSAQLPPIEHPALHELARRAEYPSAAQLMEDLATHMTNIRQAYERVTAPVEP